MSMDGSRGGAVGTVGVLAYGSLIDDPGEEIDDALIDVVEGVLTPFKVEFARKSRTRGYAPTLVPLEEGGARVEARILVVNTTEEEAANRLYRREIRKVGTGRVYQPPKTIGPNTVVIDRLAGFEGVDAVLYTRIAADIEPLTAAELARLAIGSVRAAEPGMDGISYLIAAKRNGIQTALSPQYEAEILQQTGASSLEDALGQIQLGP